MWNENFLPVIRNAGKLLCFKWNIQLYRAIFRIPLSWWFAPKRDYHISSWNLWWSILSNSHPYGEYRYAVFFAIIYDTFTAVHHKRSPIACKKYRNIDNYLLQRGVSIQRCRLSGIGIPVRDRLIFNMIIPYLRKTVFILRRSPESTDAVARRLGGVLDLT